jgi:hypothetical protein
LSKLGLDCLEVQLTSIIPVEMFLGLGPLSSQGHKQIMSMMGNMSTVVVDHANELAKLLQGLED